MYLIACYDITTIESIDAIDYSDCVTKIIASNDSGGGSVEIH